MTSDEAWTRHEELPPRRGDRRGVADWRGSVPSHRADCPGDDCDTEPDKAGGALAPAENRHQESGGGCDHVAE